MKEQLDHRDVCTQCERQFSGYAPTIATHSIAKWNELYNYNVFDGLSEKDADIKELYLNEIAQASLEAGDQHLFASIQELILSRLYRKNRELKKSKRRLNRQSESLAIQTFSSPKV